MKLNEVITLLNAGYTREEIAAFETAEQSAPVPEPAPAPDPDPEPAPAPAPEPAQPSEYERLEALLNRFINTAQANNLNAAMQGVQPARSANDILADVISPKRKGD